MASNKEIDPMAKAYDTFVERLSDLEENKETELSIRDCETYETRRVKSVVASSKNELPKGDVLWVRALRGQKLTKVPWYIKITQELGGILD
jgi:hypothetical protein